MLLGKFVQSCTRGKIYQNEKNFFLQSKERSTVFALFLKKITGKDDNMKEIYVSQGGKMCCVQDTDWQAAESFTDDPADESCSKRGDYNEI